MKKIGIIFFVVVIHRVVAQDIIRDANGFYWGDNPGENKLKYTNFSDYHKFEMYQEALEPLEWLLKNSPLLHENIYIKGTKVYQELAAKATDEKTKRDYQDKALALYDKRIAFFGKEATVLSFKASLAYEYWIPRQQYDSLYALFKKVIDLNGNDTWAGHLSRFMGISAIQRKNGKINDDDVLRDYDRVSAILTYQISATTDPSKQKELEDIQEKVNSILAKTIVLDCATIQKTFGKNVFEKREDIATAKKVVVLMLNAKCTDSPLFLQANLNVFAKEPDAGKAKVIAKLYIAEKNYSKAIEYLEKGIQLSNTNAEKKAELLLENAKILYLQGKKDRARSIALRAVETSAFVNKEAYTLIGDMYFASAEECFEPNNPLKSRAVYLAAYEMYEKAANTQGMEKARVQFPSVEEAFLSGAKEGDLVEIGCWIGGHTTVRVRK
ncbi:MAG: hypothetical protein NZ521_01030 [Flammeovirgaceae bacterium]|nr:hypothetical protein [Flammeovirgaceae bacterium]MDW8286765.1 hypothetical protein [Flammeovirgaceae bacterium]